MPDVHTTVRGWIVVPGRTGADSVASDAVACDDAHIRIDGADDAALALARAIHRRSRRRDRRQLWIACEPMPDLLRYSTLFGHLAGSFPGAFRAHRGALRQAAGGSLVLIGAERLNRASRDALDRYVETGEIWPLGATSPGGHGDVRIVALFSAV